MRLAARRSAGLITVLALTSPACTGGDISNVSGPSITRSSGTPTIATSGRIVFTSERDGHGQIYVMNADGTGQTNLSSQEEAGKGDVRDGAVACSADGHKLAFFRSTASDDFKVVTVWIMDADGSHQTPLPPNNVRLGVLGPDFKPWRSSLDDIEWSPDGSTIGFGDRATGFLTFTLGDPRYHALLPGYGLAAAWSPDGSRLVVASADIFIVNADRTGTPHRLTEGPSRDDAPDWSPDASKIAFTSSSRDGKYDRDIFVMNADGSELARLTTDEGQDTAPAWSPDGSLIAFESDRDGDREVFVMNADGTVQTALTDNDADDGHPCWLP